MTRDGPPLTMICVKIIISVCLSLSYSNKPVKSVYVQMSGQILQKNPTDLLCAQRTWKVTLVGEGADDAGGVFDETLTQMCEVGVVY